MRIIKLSISDSDMATKEAVNTFFQTTLWERKPPGKFRLTRGRLSPTGIVSGERLLFTYLGQCVYQARSASGRIDNDDDLREKYPFYFAIDRKSLVKATGCLSDLEQELRQQGLLSKNLVQSQGCPSIDETPEVSKIIDRLLGRV